MQAQPVPEFAVPPAGAEPAAVSISLPSISLPVSAEDQARADLYALAARLLLAPPDAALLVALAAADPILGTQDERPLEDAWEKLVIAAGVIDADAAAEEFSSLFIAMGTPPVNPYGSLYLSGFLNDTPLARLRDDLAALGLARAAGVGEFEDHLGALCETMRMLVAGGAGRPRQPLARQQQFFEAHVEPWFARCLADIAGAPGANFYRVVAGFVDAFLAIEAAAFAVDDGYDATPLQ